MANRGKNDGPVRPLAAAATPDAPALRQRIAELAYDLYLRRGRAPGHEMEDWLEAERRVRARSTAPAKPAPGRRRPNPAV
jgi:hypothetical protein